MKTKNIRFAILSWLLIVLCVFSACGNKNSEDQNESNSIVGYWENISGGDYEPEVCMILNFKENNQVEKIVLYTYGGDKYVSGYTEDCGPYNLNGNELFIWGKNYDISMSGNKFYIDDMVFKKLSEEDLKKRIDGVEGLSKDVEPLSETSKEADVISETSKEVDVISETNTNLSDSKDLERIKQLTDKFNNKMKEVVKYKDASNDTYAEALTESFLEASEIADAIKSLASRMSDAEFEKYDKYMEEKIATDEGFKNRVETYNSLIEIMRQMK